MSVYEWNTHPPKLFKSHCGLLIPRFVVCLIGHPPILLLSRSSEECAILSIFIPLITMSIIIRKTSRASLLHVLSIASPPNILSLPQRRRRPPMLRNLSGFLWNLQIIRRKESPSACSWFKFKLWGFYLYRDITQPHALQMDTHLLRDPTRRRESLLRLFVVVWVAAPHNFTRPTLTLTGVNPSLVVSCTCAFCIHQLHTPITFYHFTVSHSAPCPQQIIAFYSPIRPATDLFSLACCDHNNTMFWHWMVVQDSSMAPQQDNVCVCWSCCYGCPQKCPIHGYFIIRETAMLCPCSANGKSIWIRRWGPLAAGFRQIVCPSTVSAAWATGCVWCYLIHLLVDVVIEIERWADSER